MNNVIENLLKDRDYIFKKQLFKVIKDNKLSINELILIIFFMNQEHPALDIKLIESITFLKEKEILESFTSLNTKGLIKIDIVKNKDNKLDEIINLDNIYIHMVSEINSKFQDDTKEDIYSIFEKEFGRTLSPMEFEIIGAWLKSNISEELILGALKEATYNGVSNLRYIDKIIYEWGKKGFKSIEDINQHLKKSKSDNKENNRELFDYNWLEDEE